MMALKVTPAGNYVRVVTPDYVYHYSSSKKVKLADVKHQIYHPNLPTYRAMDRDSMMHKLADEHCRSTTSCTAEDFANASMNPLRPSVLRLHCRDITEIGRQIGRNYSTIENIERHWQLWTHYVEKSTALLGRPEGRQIHKDIYQQGYPYFDGAAVTYFKSDIRNRLKHA